MSTSLDTADTATTTDRATVSGRGAIGRGRAALAVIGGR
jgi:hypothetical protein